MGLEEELGTTRNEFVLLNAMFPNRLKMLYLAPPLSWVWIYSYWILNVKRSPDRTSLFYLKMLHFFGNFFVFFLEIILRPTILGEYPLELAHTLHGTLEFWNTLSDSIQHVKLNLNEIKYWTNVGQPSVIGILCHCPSL